MARGEGGLASSSPRPTGQPAQCPSTAATGTRTPGVSLGHPGPLVPLREPRGGLVGSPSVSPGLGLSPEPPESRPFWVQLLEWH